MTAAAVCETARELFGPRRHVFVTGASSSVAARKAGKATDLG